VKDGQNQKLADITVTGGGSTPTPSVKPSVAPSVAPSVKPSVAPSVAPSVKPSVAPTNSDTIPYSFALTGSSYIKAPNGTMPLQGTINAQYNLGTGNYVADLVLNPNTGAMNVMGFLPVMASAEFPQVGKTTGTLNPDQPLTSVSDMNIRLTKMTVWGFPIGGGPDCITLKPSHIELKSAGAFNPLDGGDITGAYSISALNAKGCGGLGDFISMFTAGSGNTIKAHLTPTV